MQVVVTTNFKKIAECKLTRDWKTCLCSMIVSLMSEWWGWIRWIHIEFYVDTLFPIKLVVVPIPKIYLNILKVLINFLIILILKILPKYNIKLFRHKRELFYHTLWGQNETIPMRIMRVNSNQIHLDLGALNIIIHISPINIVSKLCMNHCHHKPSK